MLFLGILIGISAGIGGLYALDYLTLVLARLRLRYLLLHAEHLDVLSDEILARIKMETDAIDRGVAR